MKLSQSNFNLPSPDSDWVRSYLIATVIYTYLAHANSLTRNQQE